MPNIHIPTLLFVLGACALLVAFVGMLMNEKESKKRAAARRSRAAQNARVLDSRTSTSTRREQGPVRKAPTSTPTEGALHVVLPKNADGGYGTPEPGVSQTLHSDSPVLDEAQQLAELMAEDAPERIVEIIREWMREDQ